MPHKTENKPVKFLSSQINNIQHSYMLALR